MMNFLRTLANAVDANAAANKLEKSSDADDSQVIIRKIEEIPSVFYADKLTEIILTQELYKSAVFLNGDFIVEYVDEKSYTCSYVLYFQEKNDETYKIEAKSKPLDVKRLSEEARNDLATNKTIKFEVPNPDENARKKYKLVKQ